MWPLVAVVALVVTADPVPSEPGTADEQDSDFEVIVRGHREGDGLDGQRRVDNHTPGFATAVELDHDAGARPADALPEVVSRVPGVTVRSMGGLGQYSAVSLRGSSSQQVAVFVDGVPLGTSVGGLVDLSDVPMDLLSRVEVYRGYVPIAFGSAAIGGAINLVGHNRRDGPEVVAGLGGGSYGGREVRVAARAALLDGDQLSLRFGYGRAEGDFGFLDVNGTPSLPSRHTTSTRTNNGYSRWVGKLAYQGSHDQWRWRVQEFVLSKQQGIPGSAQRQSTRTSLDTLAAQTIVNLRRHSFLGPGGSLEVVAGFGFEGRTFKDPLGEVGIDTDNERSEITDSYLSPRVRLPLWAGAFATAVLDARHEWTGVDNRARLNPRGEQTTGDASRQRFSLGAGLELQQFLFDGRLLVAPALRLERVQSFFQVQPGQGEVSDEGRDLVHIGFAPRVGARIRLLEMLEFRTSVGRYFRPPNMLELFGDRGFIIGNEGLVPEEGFATDAGFVLDLGAGEPFGVYAQVAGFFNDTQNLVQWQQVGSVLRPENVVGATMAGLELGLSAWLFDGRLRTQANYTYLHTRNNSPSLHTQGKQLPGRPEHEAFARISGGQGFRLRGAQIEPRGFYTFEFVAGNFLDPSGRRLVPARAFHGAGVELSFNRWLRASFEIRNLADQRVTTWTPTATNTSPLHVPLSDFIGYPLPGRSFWLNLTAEFDLAPDREPHPSRRI